MITANNTAIDHAQLTKLTDDLANAVRTKDVNASMSHYSPNVSLFDVVEPLQHIGADAVRKRTEEWLSSFQGPLDFDMHDLRIAADGDTAFSHSVNHVKVTMADGNILDMWWRSTLCYRKMQDQWLITHEHNSVPFDPRTGKASLNLKPEGR